MIYVSRCRKKSCRLFCRFCFAICRTFLANMSARMLLLHLGLISIPVRNVKWFMWCKEKLSGCWEIVLFMIIQFILNPKGHSIPGPSLWELMLLKACKKLTFASFFLSYLDYLISSCLVLTCFALPCVALYCMPYLTLPFVTLPNMIW